MSLLLVIPIRNETVAESEALVEHLYQLGNRVARHNALLVADGDVHAEVRERLKIAAELAFADFQMIRLESKAVTPEAMMSSAMKFVHANYKTAAVWLNHDCRPVGKNWLKKLEDAYNEQARRYLTDGKITVYPKDAAKDGGKPLLTAIKTIEIL